MKRYLIYGLNGAGKSAIGDELERRGYKVFEADSEISSWVDTRTGEKVEHKPPFTQAWLDNHEWRWDEQRLRALLKDTTPIAFVVGGAHNMNEFMNLFDKKFVVYANFQTVLPRLKKREPHRWLDDSPEVRQLENSLKNYKVLPGKDTVFIKNDSSVAVAADKIVKSINEA